MEDIDKEPVLLVPPPLTKSSYATLVENGYVARTWHPEGRYGSRTHKVEVEVEVEAESNDDNSDQNKERGKRIKIGLPLLKSDENIKFLKKCLQERDENNSNATSTNIGIGMEEPLSSLVRLMSTPGVELIFKKPIISNRIPKVEHFDATIHPEKMEKDFPMKLREFVQLKKKSCGKTAVSNMISKDSRKRKNPCTNTAPATPTETSFKFCELFAGIGGFGVALEKLGGTCVFASEIYEPSKHVFRSNLDISACPQQKIWGDIWDIDEKDIPPHDILVGGFPCQPFSTLGDQPGLTDTKTISGRRCGDDNKLAVSSKSDDLKDKVEEEGGINDDSTGNGNGRGQLFTQIVRILRHCQPKAFLLENVQGLVTTANGEALKIIESSLRDVGYDVRSEVISSRGLTVQARKRLYIVGIRVVAKNSNGGIDHQDESSRRSFQFPFIPDLGLRASEILHTHEELQQSFTATGIPQNLIDRLRDRKDANTMFTPASYFQISDAQMDQLRHRSKVWKPAKLAWRDKTCDVIDSHYGISVGKGNSQLVPSPAPFHPRRFTPRECARVMGFSNSFSLGEFEEQRFTSHSGGDAQFNGYIKEQYYMLGNAVCPPVISVLAGAILDQVTKDESDISNTTMENHTWLERGLLSGLELSLNAVTPQKLSEVCDRLLSQFSSGSSEVIRA